MTTHLKLILIAIVALASSCRPTPEACFTTSSNNVAADETVSFTNCSDNADRYEWDFGDGTQSEEGLPAHSFDAPGTYQIKLTAYSKKDKKQDIAETSIEVILTDGQMLSGTQSDGSSKIWRFTNFDFIEYQSSDPSNILFTDSETTFDSGDRYEFRNDGSFTEQIFGPPSLNGFWALSSNLLVLDEGTPNELTYEILKLSETELQLFFREVDFSADLTKETTYKLKSSN